MDRRLGPQAERRFRRDAERASNSSPWWSLFKSPQSTFLGAEFSVLFGFYHLHQPWGIPGSVISGVFLCISKLALPQHLDGRHRPLCSKCVLCFPDPRSRIGFGIGLWEIEIDSLFTIRNRVIYDDSVDSLVILLPVTGSAQDNNS